MPSRVSSRVEEEILAIKEAHQDWGADRILNELERRFADEDTVAPWVSPATVRRIIQRRWRNLSVEERQQYRDFSWPETMERQHLPWEATRHLLDLERYLTKRAIQTRGRISIGNLEEAAEAEQCTTSTRITNRLSQWYWRVCLATPHLDRDLVRREGLPEDVTPHHDSYIRLRLRFAQHLAAADLLQASETRQMLGRILAYEPWEIPQELEFGPGHDGSGLNVGTGGTRTP